MTRYLGASARAATAPLGRAGVVLLCAALARLAAPGDAVAQDDTARHASARGGQWIGVGLGAGFDQVACDVCAGDPKPGMAGYVRFGGTFGSRLLLGAEFDLWTRKDEEVRQYLGSLALVALLYGDASSRLYFKGGFGAVGFRAEEEGDALSSLTYGVQVGLGYDFPIGRGLSITPFANLVLAPFADIDFNGDPASSGATLGLLHGGVGLTWH